MQINTAVRNVQVEFGSVSNIQESTMQDAKDPFGHLRWRVLEEVDPEYGGLVARCLETGTTVTADEPDALRKLIKQALSLHIKLAAEREDPEALYHERAPADVWVRYDAVSAPQTETFEVDLSSTPRREVKSEISISIAQALNRAGA
jgi:hypothetical protein